MPIRLEVTIEERRYIPLEVPESGEAVVMHLTTLEPGQRRAIIQVSNTRQAQRQQLARIELGNLPREAERPRIDLSTRYRRGRLFFDVRVNGVSTGSVTARLEAQRRNPAVWTAAIVLILLVAGLGIYLHPWRPGSRAGEPTPASPTAPSAPAPEAPGVATAPEPSPLTSSPPSENAPPPATTPAPKAPIQDNWTVYFPPDEIHLTPDADRTLSGVSETLRSAVIDRISIVGHCALAGSEAGRVSISVGRAAAVADYLRSHGVDLPADAVVKGVGASDPATMDPGKQDMNRRTEISVEYTRR